MSTVGREGRWFDIRATLWSAPWLIGGFLFVLVPLGATIVLSFCQFNGMRTPAFCGLENWYALLDDSVLGLSLANTSWFAILTLGLGTIVSLATAVALHHAKIGSTWWRICMLAPTMTPLVAVGIIWRWALNGEYGLVNNCLAWFGIDGPNWLLDANWTLPSMVLISLWGVGQSSLILLIGISDVPKSIQEAARTDGAGAIAQFRLITLPLITPLILFNLLVEMMYVWQTFAVPYIMLPGGGPGRKCYFFTMYIYDMAFRYQRFGYACALCCVELLVVLIPLFIARMLIRRLPVVPHAL
jgi:multiple sugar transport system permease protein